MMDLRLHNGRRVVVNPSSVTSVVEASQSSQWHGIFTILRTVDGQVLELTNRYEEVMGMFDA